ncbi:DUF2207 domain-containing protein [Actinocrispum wychmicini]|uniref:Putative membrane protein DUF2207 n=1 Tax=Actinocrispum wychmicini TaxID=1213861 RepID=A0A4R2IMU7_9PSEU|nr:DUF2207 domain-containing protein [Actinocrispum wychmicini]TCO45329.1 putative membrane protein DUF2207 [Actinocrispum wychmicini]
MSKAARFAVTGALALGATLALAPAASAEPGEQITSYNVAVTIAADGHAHVVETIGYDFGTNQRHGLTRTVQGRTLATPATVSSPDGAPTAATTSGNTIKVGDPAVTVTGAHTYVLTYDTPSVVNPAGTGNASVDWTVVDGSWDVPILSVAGTITAPATATLSRCTLSGAPCAVTSVTDTVINVHQDNIRPHQTLTATTTFSSAGLALAVPSYTYTYPYPDPSATANTLSSPSSSSGSSGLFWVLGIGVVGLAVAGIARGAKGSGSRGSNSWYDSGSSYNSYSDSSSSSSYDSGSSSSWSDSGGSSSSDSGSW